VLLAGRLGREPVYRTVALVKLTVNLLSAVMKEPVERDTRGMTRQEKKNSPDTKAHEQAGGDRLEP